MDKEENIKDLEKKWKVIKDQDPERQHKEFQDVKQREEDERKKKEKKSSGN